MKHYDSFYQKIFKLVLPIVIQNLLSAAVSSTDVVMLSFVGQASISAVSLAANYASILFMFFYGLGTGASLLCAQYYGKKDFRVIHLVQGIALRSSIVIGGVFSFFAFLFPDIMMKVFTNDEVLIEIGASYLRWMGVAYLCWSIIEIYLSVLRSVGRVAICTALNTLAMILNIVLNAVFIFGLFGAPRLGAMGVGFATAISRFIELLVCLIVSARSKDVKLDFLKMFVRNKVLSKDFVKLCIPALINDVTWGVAFSMYSVIIGHLGSDVVAAYSIVGVARNFGTVLCFGLANAGGILLGNIIGSGDMDKARDGSKKLIKLTILSGLIGGAIILISTPIILSVAELTDIAMHYLKYMLLINSYYVMGAAVNTTMICGIFRAGGDTKFGMICDVIDMWCYAVPLGFLSAFVFKLPVMVVYFLLCTDEFVKWPWVIRRYRSEKWLNNITRDDVFEKSQ